MYEVSSDHETLNKSIKKYLKKKDGNLLKYFGMEKEQSFYVPSNEHGSGRYYLLNYCPVRGFKFRYVPYSYGETMNVYYKLFNKYDDSRHFNGDFAEYFRKSIETLKLEEKVTGEISKRKRNFYLSLMVGSNVTELFYEFIIGGDYNRLYHIDYCLFKSNWESHQKQLYDDFDNYKKTGIVERNKLFLSDENSTVIVLGSHYPPKRFGVNIIEILKLFGFEDNEESQAIARSLLKYDKFKYLFDMEHLYSIQHYLDSGVEDKIGYLNK